MRKNILLSFCMFFFICKIFSNNNLLSTKIYLADSFYYTNNHSEFLKRYEELLKDSLFNIYYKRHYDSKYINSLISYKKYEDFYKILNIDSSLALCYNDITSLYYFDSLPNDVRKESLIDSANLEFLREYPKANMKLVRVLYLIKDRDQYIRGKAANLLYTLDTDGRTLVATKDTIFRKKLWDWQTNLDSLNAKLIDTIFSKYSYPQAKDGEFLTNTPLQIIQHLNKNRLVKYYDIIYAQYLKGNIYKDNFARYYDRYLGYINCPQYYGTQATKGKDGKFYIDKTDDIGTLNERRLKMELDPLTDEEILQIPK